MPPIYLVVSVPCRARVISEDRKPPFRVSRDGFGENSSCIVCSIPSSICFQISSGFLRVMCLAWDFRQPCTRQIVIDDPWAGYYPDVTSISRSELSCKTMGQTWMTSASSKLWRTLSENWTFWTPFLQARQDNFERQINDLNHCSKTRNSSLVHFCIRFTYCGSLHTQ